MVRGMDRTKLFLIVMMIQILSVSTLIGYSRIGAEYVTSSRTVAIVDALTGYNNLTLGDNDQPMPLGGYNFTAEVVLQGDTPQLYDYQVAVKFDNSSMSCLSGIVNQSDPNFVFFGQPNPIVSPARIYPDPGYAMIGATLITTTVSVTQGLLAQFDFRVSKAGNFTLELIVTTTAVFPDNTFVLDGSLHDYEFTAQNLDVVVEAGPLLPPVASFTYAPENPQVGENVTFDGSGSYSPSGSIVNYSWDFGDGTNETSASSIAVHSFSESGAFSVSLTVMDDNGLTNSTSHDVNTQIIPEYPALAFVLVLLVSTVFGVVVSKRRKTKIH